MKNLFSKWIAALVVAALLLAAALPLSPAALMEGEVIFEASEPVERVDAEYEEIEAELDDGEYTVGDDDFISEGEAVEGAQYMGAADTEDYGNDFCYYDAPADNDTLFNGYVEQLFGLNVPAVYEARNLGGSLTGEKKTLYDTLKAGVLSIAAGQRSSTEFNYTASTLMTFSDVSDVIHTLVADCPYEMYWFGNSTSSSYIGTNWTISLTVSDDYSAGEYLVDTSKASAAVTAAANARAVVSSNAALSNYDKLVAYRDYICDVNVYNKDAADGKLPAGVKNPWQLVWVFDNDPSTNVVCEGYAKAFQYLCDMSTFTGKVVCYPVTGYGNGGPHMWNIVHMPNGRNYHVDVTFADQNDVSMRDWLFMTAPTEFVSGGYSYSLPYDNIAAYQFDLDCLDLYSTADLTLSKGNYLDEASLTAPADPVDTPSDSGTTPSDPGTTPSDPGTVASDPGTAASDPGTAASDPGTTASDPGTTASDPGTTASDPTTTTSDPVSLPSDPTPATPAQTTPVITVARNAKTTVSVGVYQINTAGATGKKFKSSKKKVATVSASGLITAKSAGKTKITFKVGKKTRTLTLTVKDPTIPSRVSLSLYGTVASKVGGTTTLTVTLPEGAVSGIKWTTSNKKIATVKNGVVTFKKAGKVTITATATRGKKKAKVNFKVSK